MKHLFIRILKQIKNDKRSIALIFLAPILVFTLLYFLLGESNYKPIISTANLPSKLTDALKEENVTLISLPANINIDNYLLEKKVDAVISVDNAGINITMLENDSVKVSLVLEKVKKAVSTMSGGNNISVNFVYGKANTNIFASLVYVLLGIISFFLVFLLAGISFIREKTAYTMERLLMTPIKRWEVVVGYTMGFGVIGAIQSIVLILFIKYILGIAFAGSIFYIILIMITLSLTAVAIGAFVSIFSNNEFQIMQFIPVVIIPQIFFSGLMSLDTIPFSLGKLAYIMPIHYGCDGLNKILIRGGGFNDIYKDLLALVLIIIIFSIVNILALKKYRKI